MAGRDAPDRRVSELILDLVPMQQATDLPDLFAGLARAVLRLLHADASAVSLLDEEGRILRDVAASVSGHSEFGKAAGERRVEDVPAIQAVLVRDAGVEVKASELGTDADERALSSGGEFARALLCPITVEGRPIGVVEALRVSDRSFRQDDPEKVRLLCTVAAGSYSRIQLASKLEAHYTETLGALASALEAKDPYTQAHTSRIRDLCMALGLSMEMPGEVRRAVSLGAILHDVGKIGISDSILLKPGPLTDEEWSVMKRHPELGESMLSGIEFLRPALPIIRHHHERWDGKGYPDGLAGEDIPLGARIVAVCDSFDAMTSDRPYRPALSVEHACDEVLKWAGRQFDPSCAALLVEVVSSMGTERLEEKVVRYASV